MQFSRTQIGTFLGCAVVAWFVVLKVQGTPVTREHLAPFGTVIGVLVTASQLLERFLWRKRWLQGWLVSRPDLRGTWLVKLQSDWKGPDGKRVAEIRCFIGVTQTLSNLEMHLMTPESESWFIADAICPSPNGLGYQVVGVYSNRPHVHLRGDRSEIHRGALVLDTHGPAWRPDAVSGEYWTDRNTAGTMSLSDRCSDVFTRFEDANRAFSKERAGSKRKETFSWQGSTS